MSEAATETVNEQLDIPVVTECQKRKIQLLCGRINRNEISKNEAFRFSQADGETEEDKGFKGTYKEWLNIALANGLEEKQPEINLPKTEEKKINYVVPVLWGVGIAILLIYTVKKFSNNPSKG